MPTVLYPSPVFGPIHSRRLGLSLGINLMPADGKVCTFDCLYCECGLNRERIPHLPRPTREKVMAVLEERLRTMKQEGRMPDVLTFAGNGEPTVHPEFPAIVRAVRGIRDRYCPQAKISVLSNATFIHRPAVREALMLVDNNIQKLDTVSPDYIALVDRPAGKYNVEEIIEQLCAFNGNVIIQTLFMKGHDAEGTSVDNTGEEYIAPWLEAIRRIAPREVMVYTIDRETPVDGLEKADRETLNAIAERVRELGIPAQASY